MTGWIAREPLPPGQECTPWKRIRRGIRGRSTNLPCAGVRSTRGARAPGGTLRTALRADTVGLGARPESLGMPSKPLEPNEDVDLDPERQRYVIDVFDRLSSLSHYELSRVRRDADTKAIKRAYFDLVGLIHP